MTAVESTSGAAGRSSAPARADPPTGMNTEESRHAAAVPCGAAVADRPSVRPPARAGAGTAGRVEGSGRCQVRKTGGFSPRRR
ncbi:hypothetical protein YW3DRAFT_01018 [Streptomyces sp. MnatMP-M77]|nr:hypothetical protein YW3DRAFT_01018 [Streptomyces sp. MnatMP-M77]